MSFISIAGVVYQTISTGAVEQQPVPIGPRSETWNGGFRIGTQSQRRSWSVPLAPLIESDFGILYAAVAINAVVPCVGDFSAGVTINCLVEIASAEYFQPSIVDPMMRLCTLVITEARPVAAASPFGNFFFLLTSVVSPDDAAAFVSTPDGSYPGDASTGADLDPGAVLPTAACPTLPAMFTSPTFAIKWLSVPLDDGWLSGIPSVRIECGSGVDPSVWNSMAIRGKLYHVRGGAVIAGPWTSGYSGGFGLLGGFLMTIAWTVRLSFALVAGDQLLLELEDRMQLKCGQADPGIRPFVYYGAVPGPRTSPALMIGGRIASL